MNKILSALLAIFILTNCKPAQPNSAEGSEIASASDNSMQHENGAKEVNTIKCIFSDPDTSVSGIKIRNPESVLRLPGKQVKLPGASSRAFYSGDKSQLLNMTIHPGENDNQVSIFNVSYAENAKQQYALLKMQEFETEKGIKLGMHKNQIIDKIGNCYVAKDSTANAIELQYRLESPDNSKTKLLSRSNMPIYYASYRFKNDKLDSFEFGFENP